MSADLIVRLALVIVGVVAVVTLLRPDIHNTVSSVVSRHQSVSPKATNAGIEALPAAGAEALPATGTEALPAAGAEGGAARPVLPLAAPADRGGIGPLLEAEGMRTGAELGVQLGLFAKHTLTSWPSCRKYYLVDLWGHQENYKDITNVDDTAQEEAFQATKNNVKDFMQKIVILRNYTVLAAHAVADGELDFVYIDARHDYCGVMEDLQSWWPKLRSGGILSGHDYLRADSPVVLATKQDYSLCMNGTVHLGAVKGAVDEFTAAHGLKVVTTQEAWPSWMARKP